MNNKEMLSYELSLAIDYIKYLEMKINKYEDYLNVEKQIRLQTSNMNCFSNNSNRIELIKIPERKIVCDSSYADKCRNIISIFINNDVCCERNINE